jgi:peptide deformylase
LKRLTGGLKATIRASSYNDGLAAPQINLHKRDMLVCQNSAKYGGVEPRLPQALITPKIIDTCNEFKVFDGCLSFPGWYGETSRLQHKCITGLDGDGKPLDRVFDGHDAVVIHQAIDYLGNVLSVDRIKNLEDLSQSRKMHLVSRYSCR